MVQVICRICQKEFVKHSGKQIYCSKDCYKEACRCQSHTPEQRARKARNKGDQRSRNPEHIRKLIRQSRTRHLEQRKEDLREWHKRNPNYRREYSRKYREKNPDRSQENIKYYLSHKLEVAAKVDRRRSRIRKAQGEWTAKQFKELCEQVDFYCAYCHKQFDKLTPDHILPLARGGSNDITNIIPACRTCNCSKRDKTPLEYLAGFKFKLA